ncbi:MAG: aldehyde ferredoxin oxidoreductase [Promethearchaeota archaeon CR_4]|nr:MAG: aldehyde ferredoxin oxidoreductase [Candidatus Lokiarchaeota archaeon CR_4]
MHGGRAVTSRIVAKEVPPHSNSLGPENKLIIAPGLLTGTPAPCSARLSIGAKSPLTGGIKESNVGGRFSFQLARNGIRGIIIEGQARDWFLLEIRNGECKINPASCYVGLGNYELTQQLLKAYGDNCGILSIGPAGERQYLGASINSIDLQGYPSRAAARGGLGSVMGSKKLKAIIIHPPLRNQVKIQDWDKFIAVSKPLAQNLAVSRTYFSQFGTSNMVDTVNEVNGIPTLNYKFGKFDGVNQINGKSLDDWVKKYGGKKRVACSPGCVIRCSNVVLDKEGTHATSSLEYETMAMNGANLGIGNLEFLLYMDHFYDDFGLDSIELGGAIGVAMEGEHLPFGNEAVIRELVGEIREGTEKGRLIANGVASIGKYLGVKRLPVVKGQGMPAYDPRVFKAMGVTFATSPQGADHTAGPAIKGRRAYGYKDYGELDQEPQKLELSKELQVFIAMMDALGFCYFVGPNYEQAVTSVKLVNAMYNWHWTIDDIIMWARATIQVEVDFNIAAGITKKDNFLPEFFRIELLPNTRHKFGIPQKDLENIWD